MTDTTPKPGRPPRSIQWIPVTYDKNQYIVGKIHFKDTFVYCINDLVDKQRLNDHNWHVVTGEYVGCYKPIDGKRKTLYMHNYITNRDGFNGKGQEETVDHINGIGFDNRQCNLRIIKQSQQNMNTKQRNRTIETLPDGIMLSELPRNVWYIPASKTHGDRFAVEFKGIPEVGNIIRKTTSSRSVSTRDKLNLAIQIRDEILKLHPTIIEHSRESSLSVRLKNEFNEIVTIAIAAEHSTSDTLLEVVASPSV